MSETVKKRRCTCGWPGRFHARQYCDPRCALCNELAERDQAEADSLSKFGITLPADPPKEP